MWAYDGNTRSLFVVISITLGLVSWSPVNGQEERGGYQDAASDRYADLNPNLVESMLDQFLYDAMDNNNNDIIKAMEGNPW